MKNKPMFLKVILLLSIIGNILLSVIIIFNIDIKKKLMHKTDNQGVSFFMERNKYFESLPAVKGSVVFLGDSHFENFEIKEQFDQLNILNRGIVGDNTRGILLRLDDIIKNQPSKIFIMIGINDLLHGIEQNETLKNYQKIIETLKTKCPDTELFVHTLFPSEHTFFYKNVSAFSAIQPLNTKIKKMCSSYQLKCIDLYPQFLDEEGNLKQEYFIEDKLHLSGKGYAIWVKQLMPYLQ